MSDLVLPNSGADRGNALSLWETSEAYSLPGLTEVDKDWLLGVPHVIVKATFWVPKKGIGHCSVEAVIAPEEMLNKALERGKILTLGKDGRAMVDPLEWVVYSDGSTGIRRQVVTKLQEADLVDVGHTDLAENGKLGDCRYDSPWTEWERFDESTMQGEVAVPSFTRNHVGGQFALRVLGGLTRSDYNDGESSTYYLR